MFKRTISLLLAVCLLLSLGGFRSNAWAEDGVRLIDTEESEAGLIEVVDPEDGGVRNEPPYTGSCGENLTWKLDANGTLTISGSGDMDDYFMVSAPWKELYDAQGEIIEIKTAVVQSGVSSIGAYAFSDCEALSTVSLPTSLRAIRIAAFLSCGALTSLTLPNALEEIDEFAFSYAGLTTLKIPASLTKIGRSAFISTGITAFSAAGGGHFKAVDGVLFSADLKQLAAYPCARDAASYSVPAGTVEIGDTAFASAEKLASVVLPEGLEIIGESAFNSCRELRSVSMASTVTTIKDSAFRFDTNLSFIELPVGLTVLGDAAFMACEQLTEIAVPEGVTKLGWAVFEDCSSLTRLQLPATLTEIVYECFNGCLSLPAIELPASLQSIGNYSFAGCSSLAQVSIPAGVEAIGDCAFGYCGNLTEIRVDESNTVFSSPDATLCSYDGSVLIQVPGGLTGVYTVRDGVENVGNDALAGCRRLTKVVFPDSVKQISYSAMANCDSLRKAVFGRGVDTIRSGIFYRCRNLQMMQFNGSAPTFEPWAFESLSTTAYYPAGDASWTEDVRQDYGGMIAWLSYTSDEDPAGGRELLGFGECGADGNNLLWELYDDNILEISGSGPMADYEPGEAPWFALRDRVKQLLLRQELTVMGISSIGSNAFWGCDSLTAAALPSNLLRIGDGAFHGCTSLTAFEIPADLAELGAGAFYGCTSLTAFTVNGNNSFRVSDGVLFTTLNRNRVLVCCPAGKTGSYAVPDGTIMILDYAFGGSLLSKVTIPAAAVSIGYDCFSSCPNLTEIVVSSDNKAYQSMDGVLFNKSGTKLIRFPAAKAGEYRVPDGVEEIGDFAFDESLALTALTVPASVTRIDQFAFAICLELKSVSFEGDAPMLGEASFYYDTLTAYYPTEADGWEQVIGDSYGGWITWVARSSVPQPPVLSLAGMSTKGVSLRWTAVDGANQYLLMIGMIDGNGAATMLGTESVQGTTYLFTDAQMAVKYVFSVKAEPDSGAGSSEALTVLFNPFLDVPGKGKTLEYIAWAYNNGIVNGTSSTKFSPNNPCTRIQFIMMLWKMHGSPVVKGTNPFSDISGKKTTNAILWALDRGIINSGRSFNPDGNISRIQIVMMLWKLAGSPNAAGENPFTDVSGSKTIKAVLWAYQNGITKGTSATTFSPDADCTRVQLVVFLYKYNLLYNVI